MKKFQIALALAAVLLSAFSCHTKPKTGSLSGMIILQNDTGNNQFDPVDYAGVTITLYQTAVSDSSFARIRSQYPQIGFDTRQIMDFDHRDSQPIRQVSSDAAGHFVMPDIDPGMYNVVLLKDGWGVKYLYDVAISSESEKDLGYITMYPAVIFSSTVVDSVTLKTGHSYLFGGDVSFIGHVVVETGANIYVSPGAIVKFFGNISVAAGKADPDLWTVASARDLYMPGSGYIEMDDYISSIEIFGSAIILSKGIMKHVSNSIALNSASSHLSDMAITECVNGLSILQGNIDVTRLVLQDISDTGLIVDNMSASISQITHSIINKVYSGIGFRSGASYNINNCYFLDCSLAISANSSTGAITYNNFEANTSDIGLVTVMTPPDISYNNFYYVKRLGILPSKTASIHHNNFYKADEYFVSIRAEWPPQNSQVYADLDVTQNYWAPADVGLYLLDAADNAEYPNAPCAHYIIYTPRTQSAIPSAGIQ